VTRRTATGVVAGLVLLSIFCLVMVPFRTHLSIATSALLLVVPVVAATTIGGFVAGLVSSGVGFLLYDWFFIPPYGTLSVGARENWFALFVYIAVVVLVARVVAVQQSSRNAATFREMAIRRLFVVTEQLISARPVNELLELVASTVQVIFDARWVALLLPCEDHLEIAATAGTTMDDTDRARALGGSGEAQSLTLSGGGHDVTRLSLRTAHRPVGQLVIAGASLSTFERELLATFANQAALAIERSQLIDISGRTAVLEEVDRWRAIMLSAVSHDLRTPLASVKAAVSTLRNTSVQLSDSDREELLELIEEQSDHLARLVANLLDSARLEAGTLSIRREVHAVEEIVDGARRSAGAALNDHHVVVRLDDDLPLVDVDLVLISQVVANLLVNASQHSAPGSEIEIVARAKGDRVHFSIIDHGTGVAREDREKIFTMMDRRAGSTRSGLGLAISRPFVRAHGSDLVVSDVDGGGANFSFDLDAVPSWELNA
jgi:two-component system sensor histidine kinase KdpD